MPWSHEEQETIIRWNELDGMVHLGSGSPITWRKCARLGLKVEKESTMKGHPAWRWYIVPKDQFRWALKSRRPGNPLAGEALARGRAVLAAKRRAA